MTNKHTRRLTPQRLLVGVGVAAIGLLTALSNAGAAGITGQATPTPPPPANNQPPPQKGALTIKPAGPKVTAPIPSSQIPGPTGNTGLACGLSVNLLTQRCIDLYARTGLIQPSSTGAASPIPIWSFTTGPNDTVALPGATLVVNQGETVTLNVYNRLPAAAGNVGLEVPAAKLLPDGGVATGNATPMVYTLSGLAPGTYLYEASGTAQGPRQVAMGLSGMLVVRPASLLPVLTGSSDLGPNTGTNFTAEAGIELQEIDATFNAAPLSTDLSQFHPQYFLINGQAFGGTTPVTINVNPTDRLLLRYVDLGLTDHEMSLVGERQTVVAQDSQRAINQAENSVEFLTAGQTQDTITTIDPHKSQGDTIALVDQAHHVYNGSAGPKLGGMVAVLNVVNAPAGSPTGPTTQVDLQPHVLDGAPGANQRDYNLQVKAGFSRTVTRAEWWVDMISRDGAFPIALNGNPTNFTIDPNDLIGAIMSNLSIGGPPIDGDHVIWIHAADAAGFGVPSGDVVTLSMKGPQIKGLQLHTTRTNAVTTVVDRSDGSVSVPLPNNIDASNDVVIIATAAATLNNWVITDARFCVDLPAGATSCPAGNIQGTMTVNPAAATPAPCNDPTQAPSGGPDSPTTVCGTIKASDLVGRPEGPHTVTIQARQALATTSNAATTTYTAQGAKDTTAAFLTPDYLANSPVTAGAFSGVVDHNTATTISLKDPWTGGTAAELAAMNGLVPFTVLSNGRWGAYSAPSTLLIDQHGPVVNTAVDPNATPPILAPSVDPNPNNGFQNNAGNVGFLDTVQVRATFDDTKPGLNSSPIDLAEAFLGTQPADSAFGTGAEMIPHGGAWSVSPIQTAYAQLPLADIRTRAEGIVPIFVHARDVAGNWGPFFTINLTLDKTAPTVTTASATGTGTTRALTVNGTDPAGPTNVAGTGVNAAEAYIGPDPGVGNGKALPGSTSPFTANVSWGPTAAPGTVYLGTTVPDNNAAGNPNQQLWVRVRDAAGNWSAPVAVGV